MTLSRADLLRVPGIVAKLANADRRGLCAKPGSGNYSTAVFRRLQGLGLVDDNFWLTDLGWEVRIAIGGSSS